MATVVEGITVGAAGGALAGITVYVLQYIHQIISTALDKKTVHTWMNRNTSTAKSEQFRSTRSIASWTNLTVDRVQYICSQDERIALSVGDKEDMWVLRVNRVDHIDFT